MKRPPMSEAELASRVVKWLEDDGWSVFHEVTFGGGAIGDGRADIVATRGDELWVVEAKRSLSFDVMAQAERWKPYASRVSIAVPKTHEHRPSDGRLLAHRLIASLELGLLEVRSLWPIEEGRLDAVVETVEPRVREGYASRLRNRLRPEHQTHAKAGESGGGHWTQWKATVAAVSRYATEHPGTTLKEALSHVEHHYSSVRSGVSSLTKWFAAGKVEGFELRQGEDRLLRVYPKEAA